MDPTIRWILMTVLFLFLLYSIGYWASDAFSSPKVRNYVNLIVNLGSVITVTIVLFDLTAKETVRQEQEAKAFAHQTENSFIDLEQEFRRSYPYLGKLYQSMNPHLDELQTTPIPEVDDPAKEENMEIHTALIIFQKIENVLLENPRADFGQGKYSEWLRTWRTWFQSPRLREIWEQSKHIYYADETVDWIERNLL
jgi:hypothetical protein